MNGTLVNSEIVRSKKRPVLAVMNCCVISRVKFVKPHSYFTRPPILLRVDAPGKCIFLVNSVSFLPGFPIRRPFVKMSGSLGVK